MARDTINPETLYKPVGYTQIVESTGRRLIYISGQVAFSVDGRLVGDGDFAAQSRESYANLRLALEAVGATAADLVNTTTYVIDLDSEKLGTLRDVRSEFFGSAEPASSTLLGVSALAAAGLLIEVDAVAVLD